MNEKALQRLREEMTPQRFTLENGLTVLVREMPQFRGVHAIYATRFGSADLSFELDGRQITLPEGTAHFLEHKMFENADGVDAFALYERTGAMANAYTSFEKTCYVFTATRDVEQNLDILLDFVSHPYFTEQTVKKELGIIGQEIKMYEDSAEFQMMFGLLGALYHRCPVRTDIAGTTDSIASITPELLYRCCEAFYAPQNMVLSVAGHVTAQQVLEACARADIRPQPHQMRRLPPEEPETVFCPFIERRMPVSLPIWGIGFKQAADFGASLRGRLICDFVTELLAGETSPLYNRLYDEGLINAGFSGEYLSGEGYCALYFAGDTRDPEALQQAVWAEIDRLLAEGVDAGQFDCTKNMMLGELITGLENIEDVAYDQAVAWMEGYEPYEAAKALAALTAADVQAALPQLLRRENSAVMIIWPDGTEDTSDEDAPFDGADASEDRTD